MTHQILQCSVCQVSIPYGGKFVRITEEQIAVYCPKCLMAITLADGIYIDVNINKLEKGIRKYNDNVVFKRLMSTEDVN